VKSSPAKVLEVPIEFRGRLHGESKLSAGEQLLYIRRLARLFRSRSPYFSQLVVFCLIRASGMMVDLFFVFVSYEVLAVLFRLARVVGFLFALRWYFWLNRRYKFRRSVTGSVAREDATFLAVRLTGFSVNWLVSVYLFENLAYFHRFYLVSALLGIVVGTAINFLGSKFIVFR